MSEIITVGLDLAKNVFQAHGADASIQAVLRKKLRRDQALEFFARLPSCVVAMEACGGEVVLEIRESPRVYRRVFGSNVRLHFRCVSSVHRKLPPLRLA